MCVIYVQTEFRSCSELELLDGGDVYLRLHLAVMVCTRKRKRDDQMGGGHRPRQERILAVTLDQFHQAFTCADPKSAK